MEKQNKNLVLKLKEKLKDTEGTVYESLKHKIKKLDAMVPSNILSTEYVLTHTEVLNLISKEEQILRSFDKITVTDRAITEAIVPMRDYCYNKIYMLQKVLKRDFRCFKTGHERVTSKLKLKITELDLDPGTQANTMDVLVDRKHITTIDLKNCEEVVELNLKEAMFIEFILTESESFNFNKTRVGLLEIPCDYFVNESKTDFVFDFLDYNYVNMKVMLKTSQVILRNQARILCLERRGHMLEKISLHESGYCNVCGEVCVVFAACFRCNQCNVPVHNKCVNFVFFRCIPAIHETKINVEQKANFNIPHQLEEKSCEDGKHCHHCGLKCEPKSNVLQCKLCSVDFHEKCKKFLFPSCGITKELRIELCNYIHPNKFLSSHLMNAQSASEFQFLSTIGTGATSNVVHAIHKKDNKDTALKIIVKSEIYERFDVHRLEAEKRILDRVTELNCPFLTKLLYFFQDKRKIYLGLEYCSGGDLLTYVMSHKTMSEDQIKQYTAEIVVGLFLLHQHEIAHRDLKLDNVLIGADGHVKLCDFGLAKEQMTVGATAFTFCGTPDTMAPELFKQVGYTRDIDYWSLGVIVYEMFHRRPPFSAPTVNSLAKIVATKEIEITAEMSPEAKDFIIQLTQKDPMNRLGFGPTGMLRIRNHPWFMGIVWDDVIFARNKVLHKPKKSSELDVTLSEKDRLVEKFAGNKEEE